MGLGELKVYSNPSGHSVPVYLAPAVPLSVSDQEEGNSSCEGEVQLHCHYQRWHLMIAYGLRWNSCILWPVMLVDSYQGRDRLTVSDGYYDMAFNVLAHSLSRLGIPSFVMFYGMYSIDQQDMHASISIDLDGLLTAKFSWHWRFPVLLSGTSGHSMIFWHFWVLWGKGQMDILVHYCVWPSVRSQAQAMLGSDINNENICECGSKMSYQMPRCICVWRECGLHCWQWVSF